MRKIYSLVLMTAMLLVGTKVWATNVQIASVLKGGSTSFFSSEDITDGEKNAAALQQAFDCIADGETASVTLLCDISITRPIYVTTTSTDLPTFGSTSDQTGKDITFKLQQFTINATDSAAIRFSRGKLRIEAIVVEGGKHGTIKCTNPPTNVTDPKDPLCTVVYMSGNSSHVDNFTILEIGPNVEFYSEGRGLEVADNYQSFNNHAYPEFGSQHYACGVRVIIESGAKIHAQRKYGIQVNGTIVPHEDMVFSNRTIEGMLCEHDVPYFHLYDGAIITSGYEGATLDETKKTTAIYASGWAYWNIDAAEITSYGTGVYVKGGTVDINGAHISSIGNTHVPITSGQQGSGTSSCGSGIAIQSQDGWPGDIAVTISGETTVTSESGNAIEEKVTTENNISELENLTINGGTFDSAEGKDAVVIDLSSKDEVVVEGGNYSTDITTLLPDNGIVTETTDNEGNTVYVIGTKDEEAGDWITDINSANATSYVKLNGTAIQSLNASKTIDYLTVLDNASLTIPTDVTLTANNIVMGGTNSRIRVEKGGALVIAKKTNLSGVVTSGIVANHTQNIILEADPVTNSNNAKLYIHPEIIANRHPYAQVEITSTSYYVSSADFHNERIGIPSIGALTSITAKDGDNNVRVAFSGWKNGAWSVIGFVNPISGDTPLDYDDMATPFVYYQMTCVNPTPNTKVTMSGSLVGNDNPSVDIAANDYATFSNSYTATLNGNQLFTQVLGNASLSGTIWVSKSTGANHFAWDTFDKTVYAFESNKADLEPMQVFMVHNDGVETNLSLNYNSMVWTPKFGGSSAPARAQEQFSKMIKVSVAGTEEWSDNVYMLEDDQFTTDMERGYESLKQMNDGMNLYIMDAEKMSSLATDNMNNTYLGFACEEAGVYTLNFNVLNGSDMMLIDMNTNTTMEIAEGGSYQFYADANSQDDYRFRIVSRQEMPTNVETIEGTTIKSSGIYTLTGQYLGDMNIWNNLPAGLYIVNGEKKVK